MTTRIDHRDSVALVTGASSGIGRSLAVELARRGANVALVARRKERLDAIANELADAGHRASGFPCDIRDPDAVAGVAQEVRRRFGEVDLLVNSAGYARHVLFADHDTADIHDMMLTNYMGTVYWTKQVLPDMRRRRAGAIVNVSSFAGKIAQADEVAYSASKFAVTGLSAGLAQELEPLGIRVLCVYPTLVRTEMFTPEVMARMPSGSPKFIEPEDFARRTLRALHRGSREAIIPAHMKTPIVISALFPEWMGKLVGRVKMRALHAAGVDADA